jgi:hypothetical protein
VQDTGQSPSAISINDSNGTFKAPAASMPPGKSTVPPMCNATADFKNGDKIDPAVSLVNTDQIVYPGYEDGAFKAPILSAVPQPICRPVTFSKVCPQNAQPPCGVTLPKSSERRAGLRVDRRRAVDTERFHDRRTSCKRMQRDMPPHARFGQ